jgi:hypothetical protein
MVNGIPRVWNYWVRRVDTGLENRWKDWRH